MKLWPFPRAVTTEAKSLAEPDSLLEEIFGVVPTNSGVAMTGAAALRVPAVSSAIRVISEAAASLDVMVKITGAKSETDDLASPIRSLLRGEANEWTSGYELIRDLVIDALD